jgi:hypothetical protein
MRKSKGAVDDRGGAMQVVHCPCGVDVEGESDDQLVENVQAHIASDHPEQVGNYSREQILDMAHQH